MESNALLDELVEEVDQPDSRIHNPEVENLDENYDVVQTSIGTI